MSTTDDHNSEMNAHGLLDDATAEAILAGRPVPDPALGPVAGLVAEMRSLAGEPAPLPSAELAAILAGGPVGAQSEHTAAETDVCPPPAVRIGRARRGRSGPKPLSRLLRNAAAAGLAARVALGTGVAAASMTGAAAAGVLPGPVQDAVADVVKTVTPFEFPRHTDSRPEPPAGVSPEDGDEAPGTAPGRPADGLPGSADPRLPSGPETSPSTAPSPSAGRAPSSPAPTAATTASTGPRGTTPTTGPRTTPTTGAAPSETDTTPGAAPGRPSESTGVVTEPAPAPAQPTPLKPEAGSTGPGPTTEGSATAPGTAAPDIDDGGSSAPVPSGIGRP